MEEKRKYVNDYRLLKGCSVCGYNKCTAAIEFHHEGNDKKDTIAHMIHHHQSLKKIKKEIDKCILLCFAFSQLFL